MEHECFSARRAAVRCAHAGALIVAASFAALTANAAAAAGTVPAQFQGKWVPAPATCESAARLLIEADKLTVVNGADSQALGGIEMAGPGYFAPGYRGIMAVLITEFDAQQPATVTFNVGEKKGVAQIDFAPVMPGKPTPMLTAYNARISKLGLAKRFPLDKVPLKKCAGG